MRPKAALQDNLVQSAISSRYLTLLGNARFSLLAGKTAAYLRARNGTKTNPHTSPYLGARNRRRGRRGR